MMSTGIGDPGSIMMGPSGDISEENNSEYYGAIHNSRPRYPGLYVGNLTWWTTDQDVIDAICSFGVTDVQEVKFFENRNNGQSRGFCVVTFSSEASLPIVKDKLPKIELHGQKPIVTPYTRQNLSLFESQNKTTRPQINSNNVNNPAHGPGIMGINSISGVHASTQGLPYSGLNTYNQGGTGMGGVGMGGGPRAPGGYGMRMQMRGPRPGGMRGQMQNPMSNGPMGLSAPGSHQMNRMRFLQPPSWDNPQNSLRHQEEIRNSRHDDVRIARHDDVRTSRNDDDRSSRHDDDRSSRHDESRSRHDDTRTSSSSAKMLDDGRDRSRRDEMSVRDDRSSRKEESSSSRRSERDGSSRRDDDRSSSSGRRDERESSSRRDDRSSRREEKSSSSSSSSKRHHHHHSDRERSRRSRSRSRNRDRSRDRSRERARDKKSRY